MYTVCLVEDELKTNDLIITYLKKEGFNTIACTSGEQAINALNEKIHLWILDIMLGDNINGYDLIKKIRSKSSVVPVIFTTARDQELDKIIGLELEADDYLTKPYSPKELMLRVNRLIKRVYHQNFNILNYNDYIIDINKRVVKEKEEVINLTSLEFDLLVFLLKNKNTTFAREDILIKVWGDDYFGRDRVVDDLIRRLRSKMKLLNIETVYGYGYRLL